jgi:hypothetical protein
MLSIERSPEDGDRRDPHIGTPARNLRQARGDTVS